MPAAIRFSTSGFQLYPPLLAFSFDRYFIAGFRVEGLGFGVWGLGFKV